MDPSPSNVTTRKRGTPGPLAEAMDRVPNAVLFVEARGRVTYANRAAQVLLARRSGLTLGAEGDLQVHQREQHAELRRLIARAIRAARTGSRSIGECLVVTKPGGGRPLAVTVSPSRMRAMDPGAEPMVVNVLVADPDSPACPRQSDLALLYRLTRREADVAVRLALGKKLTEIAVDMGIGLEAARTHLARVMQKTDTHRQPELVRLLLLGCPLGGETASEPEVP